MKYFLERKITVPFSYCGANTKLSLYGIINYSQNILTDFFKTIDTDNYTLKTKSNAAWVMAKSKTLIFSNLPHWGEEITVKSFCAKKQLANILIVNEYRNSDGVLLISDIKQMCPIDLDTRKIRMLKTISIKDDLDPIDLDYEFEFNGIKEELSEDELDFKSLVRYSDLDGTNHVNNAVYVRYLDDSIDRILLDEDRIKELEIYYLAETRYNETLSIYKRKGDNEIVLEIKNDSKTAIKAKIKY